MLSHMSVSIRRKVRFISNAASRNIRLSGLRLVRYSRLRIFKVAARDIHVAGGRGSFKGALFREQYLGTLEKLFLLCAAPDWLTVLLLGGYTFITGTLRVFGYLLAGLDIPVAVNSNSTREDKSLCLFPASSHTYIYQ